MNRRTRRRLFQVAAVVAAVIAASFLIRALAILAGWGPEPPRPIEGWMTPRYLIRIYDLPPEDLAHTLGVDPHQARVDTLERIATRRGIPLRALIAEIEALRESHSSWR